MTVLSESPPSTTRTAYHVDSQYLDALYNEPGLWALYIARSIYTLVEATTVSQPYTALRIA
jgi:hypothetical protein